MPERIVRTLPTIPGRSARFIAGLALMAGGLSGCVGTPATQGTHCADSSNLETCVCDSGCQCWKTSCGTGTCIASGDATAFCAMSAEHWPGCNPAVDHQTLCDGTSYVACLSGYRLVESGCSGVCVSHGETALCAASTELWPACDPAVPVQHLCEGDVLFECQYGYRTLYPTADAEADCGPYQRCISDGIQASCAPRASAPSPFCPPTGRDVMTCAGTTQIYCSFGYLISNHVCASCAAGECQGGFGGLCSTAADCRGGFSCRPQAGTPFSYCEVPCAGPEVESAACAAALSDPSLPQTSRPPSCVAGWCVP